MLYRIVVPKHLLIALLFSLCAFADAPDAADIRKSAGEVVKSLDIQSRLPNDSGATALPSNRQYREAPRGFGDAIYIPGADVIFGLMQWALVVVVVIGILAVAAILIREPMQSRFRPALSPPLAVEGESSGPTDPRELLARADRLAAEGRFAEAMHCVLLATMIVLGGPAADRTTDSRTSWELLRQATVPAPQIQPLRDLVIRVERAWFGQRPAGADDYRHVRGIFDAFHSASAETA